MRTLTILATGLTAVYAVAFAAVWWGMNHVVDVAESW